MKKLTALIAVIFFTLFGLVQYASAATPALTVPQGGTASSTLSGILKGNGTAAVRTAVNGVDFTLITVKTCNAGDFVSAVTAAGVFTCTTPTGGATYTAFTPLSISAGNVLAIATSSASVSGFLQASDFSKFNSATSTFSSPLSYSTATNAVTCPTCNTSNATVSSIATNNGITGGTITTTGTLSLDQSFGAVWTAASTTFVNHLAINTASTTILTAPSIFTGLTAFNLLSTDANGKAVATSSIGNTMLANSTISGVSLGGTLAALTNGTGITSAGTYTGNTARTFALDQSLGAIWTAASTTFTQHLALFNASSTQFTHTGSTWFTGTTNAILGTDANGLVAATTTIGVNYLTGTLPVTKGGTGAATLTGCLTGNGTGAITGSGTCNTSNATVSSVATGNGLTGGTITTTGTVSLDQTFGAIWTAASTTFTNHLSLNNASSTQFTSPTIWTGLGTAAGTFLAVDPNGKIIATSTPSGASGANPTASVGLTAVNGVATTFMRSDAAPALSTSITPTWSNLHIFSAGASSTQLSVFIKAYFGGTATTTIDSSGNLSVAGTSLHTGATTLSAALTYGGVTLSNAVTGTGNMVLSASPTFTGKITLAAASSTDFTASNSFYSPITSAVLVADANKLTTAATTQTCTNQFVRAMSASYSATCATVGAADVSLAALTATDSTLTFSGSYTGATARTIGINLANPNTWTGLQTINSASSTNATFSTFLTIPNSSSPSLAQSGAIAINTSAASSSLQYYDGTAQRGLYDVTPFKFTFTNYPTNGQGTTTVPMQLGPRGEAYISLACKSVGGTANVQLGNYTASTTMVISTTGTIVPTTISSNNSFNAWTTEYWDFGTFSASGTTTVTCSGGRRYSY